MGVLLIADEMSGVSRPKGRQSIRLPTLARMLDLAEARVLDLARHARLPFTVTSIGGHTSTLATSRRGGSRRGGAGRSDLGITPARGHIKGVGTSPTIPDETEPSRRMIQCSRRAAPIDTNGSAASRKRS
jgi:hypothetical protein